MRDGVRVRSYDPVTFELIRYGLESLGDEMAATMAHAAYSPIIRNAHDLSTALLTSECEVIAQGRTNPLQLGSIMPAARAVVAKFSRQIGPGDIFILNDPYEGGSHLPDIFLIKPLYARDQLVGFAGSEAHHSDVGGRVAGSNASDSREIYEEGLRIPPSYLFRAGDANETLFDVIRSNCRFPEQVMGDLGAQMAALKVGEKGFRHLVERYGHEELKGYIARLFEHAERVVRAEFSSWPDGLYEFADYIDDDGTGNGPIPIHVQITVSGDSLTIDYSGTGAQVESAINTPKAFTQATAMTAVRCAIGVDVPHNSGYMRPVTVIVPEGTILNARPPAAVAARALAAFRAFDATIGCLAKIVPKRLMACGDGGASLITFSGLDGGGRKYILTDMHLGAWGGRQDRDGVDGISSPLIAITNVPVETIERETPLRITRYEFIPDSCGAGRFRGGLASLREYRIDSGSAMVQFRSDRAKVRSYGLFGGRPGASARNVLNPGPLEKELPSKHTTSLNCGDVYRSVISGAGGWGDPLERDPQSVREDVRNEKVTRKFAAREFGVAIDAAGRVDLDATRSLRGQTSTRIMPES